MRPAASTLKLRSLNDIRRRFALGLGLLLAPFSLAPSEIEAAEGPVTVLTATQRREVATVSRGDGELVAIDDVLAGLDVRLTPDARGQSLTITRGSHELVLHNRKSLASVDGDLKLLPSPAVLEGGRWLVPVEGLARVLPALLERPVEWRSAQRVLLVACFSMLQDFRMRRLWAVWQATDGGALQAYAARRDGDGVTMDVVPDAAPLWSVLGEPLPHLAAEGRQLARVHRLGRGVGVQ